jgi:hypothetical protein
MSTENEINVGKVYISLVKRSWARETETYDQRFCVGQPLLPTPLLSKTQILGIKKQEKVSEKDVCTWYSG